MKNVNFFAALGLILSVAPMLVLIGDSDFFALQFKSITDYIGALVGALMLAIVFDIIADKAFEYRNKAWNTVPLVLLIILAETTITFLFNSNAIKTNWEVTLEGLASMVGGFIFFVLVGGDYRLCYDVAPPATQEDGKRETTQNSQKTEKKASGGLSSDAFVINKNVNREYTR